MSEPRYYVRHQDATLGRHANPLFRTPAVSYIRDRLYNCRDVAAFTLDTIPKQRRRWGHKHVYRLWYLRQEVERLCAKWNAEYEAWLAS